MQRSCCTVVAVEVDPTHSSFLFRPSLAWTSRRASLVGSVATLLRTLSCAHTTQSDRVGHAQVLPSLFGGIQIVRLCCKLPAEVSNSPTRFQSQRQPSECTRTFIFLLVAGRCDTFREDHVCTSVSFRSAPFSFHTTHPFLRDAPSSGSLSSIHSSSTTSTSLGSGSALRGSIFDGCALGPPPAMSFLNPRLHVPVDPDPGPSAPPRSMLRPHPSECLRFLGSREETPSSHSPTSLGFPSIPRRAMVGTRSWMEFRSDDP